MGGAAVIECTEVAQILVVTWSQTLPREGVYTTRRSSVQGENRQGGKADPPLRKLANWTHVRTTHLRLISSGAPSMIYLRTISVKSMNSSSSPPSSLPSAWDLHLARHLLWYLIRKGKASFGKLVTRKLDGLMGQADGGERNRVIRLGCEVARTARIDA